MSNRKMPKAGKVKALRLKCPRCAGKMLGKPYTDGYAVYVCQKCKFPKRVKQP